ncbi:hypothetical protein [Rubellimicrobium arenae]|uniref:hypothetical protein n=1 Tax=Rubellimicrobium arenae TaxID=2817372 RepID=UPI001B31553F|nr:hypothetical protein [Rubellimicrobium arenae]
MTAIPRAALVTPLPGSLIDSRGWLTMAWVGVLVFTAALVTLMALGRWDELQMAAAFYVPMVAVMLVPHGLPALLVAVIAGCFLISGAGWAWDWYSLFWWFDIALHTLNPFAIMAGSMFMFWKAGFLAYAPRKGRFVLWAAGLGLLIGIVWEVIEYTYLPLTWPDTILDIVMDTAGAALGGWFAIWLIEQRGLALVGPRRLATFRVRPWSAQPVPVPVRTRR